MHVWWTAENCLAIYVTPFSSQGQLTTLFFVVAVKVSNWQPRFFILAPDLGDFYSLAPTLPISFLTPPLLTKTSYGLTLLLP